MIKPEDLLDAYDSLCINAQKKIEAIFVRADQKKFAVAFKDNWSYFMIPPPSPMPPETLKMDQIILVLLQILSTVEFCWFDSIQQIRACILPTNCQHCSI